MPDAWLHMAYADSGTDISSISGRSLLIHSE
jgi:hypothetical protein